MDIYNALDNAQATKAKAEQELADLIAQAEAKRQSIQDLDIEVAGLQRAIARHETLAAERGPDIQAEAGFGQALTIEVKRANGHWAGLSRISAVEQMMLMVGEPMSPRALSEKLQAVGRDDTPDIVGKALFYLLRKDRAKKVGRAKWVAQSPDVGRDLTAVKSTAQGEEVNSDQEVNGAEPALTGGGSGPDTSSEQ